MAVPALRILPTKQLLRLLATEDHPHGAAVISCTEDLRPLDIPIVHHVAVYEDIDREVPGRSLSSSQAEAIADFVRRHGQHAEELFICCDAGESRSPAVAAAVCRYLGLEEMWIWGSPRYHPNMLVFQLVSEAFGLPVTDEMLDYYYYTNAVAFSEAIRKARG